MRGAAKKKVPLRISAWMYDEVGGFGSLLLLFWFDYSENPEAWHESMRLLAHEVMPKVAHLVPPQV